MSWWHRDPDLGRDRATKALGRRDWNWFAPYSGSSGAGAAPVDVERADTPWAGHPTTAHDRHDRTLGIPPRHVSMWPDHQPALDDQTRAPRRQLAAVLDDLRRLPGPPPPATVTADVLAAALTDLAGSVYGRPAHVQAIALTEVAHEHRLDPAALAGLARGVGETIAKTSHRSARVLSGEPALNALAGANLRLAAELHLARAHLGHAAADSDPDLARLWILANALTHRIPAHLILTVPARSAGPITRLVPTHDDLIGWPGVRHAVVHLDHTLQAIHTGRRWLAGATDTPATRLLALGVLHLTDPALAYRLAARGPAAVDLTRIRRSLTRDLTPQTIAELSDPALKAVCDRNGWLLGTADERTSRELIERHTKPAEPATRARLASGDTAVLTVDLTDQAPADSDLDRAAWRDHPATPEVTQRRQLLDAVSREALHRFAGLEVHPHPSRAAALAARYPDRLAHLTLRTPAAQLRVPGQAAAVPAPQLAIQPSLDLGL